MDLQYVFGNPKRKGKKSKRLAKKRKSATLKRAGSKKMAKKRKKSKGSKRKHSTKKRRNPAILEIIDTKSGRGGKIGSVKRLVGKAPTHNELKQLKQIWKGRTKLYKKATPAELSELVAKNRKTQAELMAGGKKQKKFKRIADRIKRMKAKGGKRWDFRTSKEETRITDQGDTVHSLAGKAGAMARKKKAKKSHKKAKKAHKKAKRSKKSHRKAKKVSHKRKKSSRKAKKSSHKARKSHKRAKKSHKRSSKRRRKTPVTHVSTISQAKKKIAGAVGKLRRKRARKFVVGKGKSKKSFTLKRNPFGGSGMLDKASKLASQALQHSFSEAGSLVAAGVTHQITDLYGRKLLSYIPMSDTVLNLPVIGPAVPNLLLAGLVSWISERYAPAGANKIVQSYAKSLAATSIIAAGQSLGQQVGLSGIVFTPRMSGVEYFPMNGVKYFPKSGVAGMGYEDASEQGQLGDPADFGAADYGPGGFSDRKSQSDADFGDYDPQESAHLG